MQEVYTGTSEVKMKPIKKGDMTGIYMSYAKDIFKTLVALDENMKSPKETMAQAIELVKQAKGAFENAEV